MLVRLSNSPKSIPGWLPAAGLLLIVIASALNALWNGWVQDDIPIILTNELVHSIGIIPEIFTSSYWPAPFPPDLYRPLALLSFALQWIAGGGEPLLFRIISVILYAGTTLAVWRLAGRLLSPTAAWVVAALFAAHPVHVEAVAVAVNQAELVVALILTLAVTAWIDRRRAQLSTGGRWGFVFAAAYMIGILYKEHAIVLPALLIALELTVLNDGRHWKERLRSNRQVALGMALMVAVALFVRDLVLAGNTKGSFTTEALVGLDVGSRGLTMLGVVPEWARLLVWPQHLQADYAIQEIMPATGIGGMQILGAALLGLALVILVTTARRLPVAAFGVAWLAIGLGPVHNVLVPTGIMMAERTLFLGSIGFLFGSIALLTEGYRVLTRSHGEIIVKRVATASVAALLIMGISRSSSRQQVWSDLPTLWRQTLIDAPKSFRAHHAYAQILFRGGQKGAAERHFRRAIELHPTGWPIYVDLADKYRFDGQCWPAIELYQAVIELNPKHAGGRGSLVACLVHLGQFGEAARVARSGVEIEDPEGLFSRYAEIADSAARVGADPSQVKLPIPDSTGHFDR